MENNRPDNGNAPKKTSLIGGVRWFLGSLWKVLSNNFGLKVLSLLVAILLWNYIITTDTSITRTKTLNGLTGYVSGQATLTANRLALLNDPTDELSNISVTVDAPQSYYNRVSNDNIQVSLDLSSVRTAGTQEVPLRAVASYGRVTEITPETLTLTFESLDSRSVPINSVLTGASQDEYWYSVTRMNPSYLTVSGAGSVVRSITSATVYMDVSGHDSPFTQAQPFALFDASGEEISQQMLNLSSSSVSLSIDVYPTKDLPVSTDLAKVITGQPAEGYVVQSVTMQPETVLVSADKELLDGLTELVIQPVSVEGASQSFSARAAISQLSGIKNLSTEQVYVNVSIAEASISGRVDDVGVLVFGKGEGLNVEYDAMAVYITGPRSEVERLQADGIVMYIDLTGLTPGNYEIEPIFDTERYPAITFQPERETMMVTLTSASEDE